MNLSFIDPPGSEHIFLPVDKLHQIDAFRQIAEKIALVVTVHKAFQLFSDQIEYDDVANLIIIIDAEMRLYGIGKDLYFHLLGKGVLINTLLALSKCGGR